MNACAPIEVDPLPLELDPRPCSLCGLTIDRHEMIDEGEGPEFFCLLLDEMTLPELELRAELIRQIEVAGILARMDSGPEFVPEVAPPHKPKPYRPVQATIDAFWFVIRLDDPDYLARWLAQHPGDASHLHEIWRRKCATAA